MQISERVKRSTRVIGDKARQELPSELLVGTLILTALFVPWLTALFVPWLTALFVPWLTALFVPWLTASNPYDVKPWHSLKSPQWSPTHSARVWRRAQGLV